MSVLVYAESWEGKFKKSSYEAVWYAKKTADLSNSELITLSVGDIKEDDLVELSKYGASRIILTNELDKIDSQALSSIVEDIVKENNVTTIIFSNSYTSKMAAPRLGIKLNASILSNVTSIALSTNPFQVKRKVFSGKAFELSEATTEKQILIITPNSFSVTTSENNYKIERVDVPKSGKITVQGKEKTSGKINLSEAEIIVSAGRGLKGPENWQMIEDLAELLGAATACSKPVSDIGWRPHSEHVGQTGKAVAPNLYIAIGISGAIQHLAGVNSSKIMVVINTDSEAPFFKAADYGIVGDAFQVIPKLIEEIKQFKK